jgi:hypothetical protein
MRERERERERERDGFDDRQWIGCDREEEENIKLVNVDE